MDSKEYDVREHVVTEKVLIHHSKICDICKKEIPKGTYFRLISGHHEWGNDSIDSMEYLDVCSQDCIAGYMLNNYFPNQKKYDSQYLEVRPEYWEGTIDN